MCAVILVRIIMKELIAHPFIRYLIKLLLNGVIQMSNSGIFLHRILIMVPESAKFVTDQREELLIPFFDR